MTDATGPNCSSWAIAMSFVDVEEHVGREDQPVRLAACHLASAL